MLTESEIAGLIAHAERSGIRALAIEEPGFALRLDFPPPAGAPPAPPPSAPPAEAEIPVKTAGFGRLVTAPPLGGPAYAMPGETVAKGDIVALLKLGPLYRPVRAPAAGIVETALAEPDTLVGYGDEILRLKPNRGRP